MSWVRSDADAQPEPDGQVRVSKLPRDLVQARQDGLPGSPGLRGFSVVQPKLARASGGVHNRELCEAFALEQVAQGYDRLAPERRESGVELDAERILGR